MFKPGEQIICIFESDSPYDYYTINYQQICIFNGYLNYKYNGEFMIKIHGYDNNSYYEKHFISLKNYRKQKLKQLRKL